MKQFMLGIASAITSVSPSVGGTDDNPCTTSRHLLGECEMKPKE